MVSSETKRQSLMGSAPDLLAKLERATGPDRELDALIDIACGPKPLGDIEHWVNLWDHGWRLGREPGHVYMRQHAGADEYANYPSPAVTASLDAALALVERVLPGWGFDITYRAAWGNCTACVIANDRRAPPHTGAGATPAFALLSALIRALIATNADGAERLPNPREANNV